MDFQVLCSLGGLWVALMYLADGLLPPTTAIPYIHVTAMLQLSQYELTRVFAESVRLSVRSSVGFMSRTAGLVAAKFDLQC
jgi:hypothetical protein